MSSQSSPRLKSLAHFSALCVLTSLPASGAALTWDNATTNSNWNTTDLNWTGAAWNNATPDDAVFGATGAGTVNLTTGITAQSLTFDVTGYTIAGASTLTLGGATPTITTATGVNAIISAPVAGTTGLTKAGEGTLTFGSQKTYTGNTIINAGILDITGGGGASGAIRGTATVNTGGVLRLSTGDATGYNGGATALTVVNLNGGTLNINTASNQTLGSATINMTGGGITGITGSNLDFFGGGSALNTLASATTSTITGAKINLRQNGGVGFNIGDGAAAVDLKVNSVISASTGFTNNNLIKTGAGTMEIAGVNTYATATQVNAGKLTITGSVLSTSGLSVASGATLELNSTNTLVGGHGTAIASTRTITVDGGTLIMGTAFEARFGSVTLSNGATWTNNRPAASYGALLGNTSAGAATISVTGTGASTINGSGGMNIQGVQNFDVADVTGNAGADLIISSILGGTGTNGGAVGGINKTGSGTMLLSNLSNAFAGNITVSGGQITTGTGQGGGATGYLGAVNGTRVITVNSGATLQLLANNQFGGSGKTAATIPGIVLAGGTLNSTRFNIIGNTTLNGGTLSQSATDTGGYQGYQFLGDVTVGGSAVSTISTGNDKSNHLRGGATTLFTVADATGSTATDLLVSAPLANGSGDYAGAGSLTKSGAGTMELGATNSYTGATSVTAGRLLISGTINSSTSLSVKDGEVALGTSDRVNDAATVSLDYGTLNTGGFSETMGVLTIVGENTLDLGTATSLIRFADSSAAIWGQSLIILNWSGLEAGGGTDQVFFGNSALGLTGDQLSKISFSNPAGFGSGNFPAAMLPTGEVVPIPEAGLLSLLPLGLLGCLRRRR